MKLVILSQSKISGWHDHKLSVGYLDLELTEISLTDVTLDHPVKDEVSDQVFHVITLEASRPG